MKLAYLVLSHDSQTQLASLCELLAADRDEVFVHQDRRFASRLDDQYIRKSGVQFHPSPYASNWGGFNIVRATLDLMAMAVKGEADYFVLMSATTFPLSSHRRLKKKIESDNASGYFHVFDLPHKYWGIRGGRDRVEDYHFSEAKRAGYRVFNRIVGASARITTLLLGRKKIAKDLKLRGGSQWWLMSRPLVEACLREWRKNSKRYSFFETALLPDEMFFQTMVWDIWDHSSLKTSNLLYLRWGSDRRPERLSDSDIRSADDSFYFARKIYLGDEGCELDALRERFANC